MLTASCSAAAAGGRAEAPQTASAAEEELTAALGALRASKTADVYDRVGAALRALGRDEQGGADGRGGGKIERRRVMNLGPFYASLYADHAAFFVSSSSCG